jgi:toluene monooxygenase system protein E
MKAPRSTPNSEAKLRTYSHLAGTRRQPTEYEIVTTRLHHHVERGFEVQTPVASWYERYERGSRWQATDWERFVDPRETTYTKYTRLQHAKESFVDGLLASIDDSSYDRALGPEARALFERVATPLRFVWHGLQMIAAYVGQMAPAGRVTIAALFQSADEVRRIQRVAYRTAQLRLVDPACGADSRARFETDPAWQPLRRLVESLLVTYDWAEAFVALDVCLKPALDELCMVELPTLARAHGDFLLGQIFASLDEDCQWHRRWTAALTRVALAERADNGVACAGWVEAWMPEVTRALVALEPLLRGGGNGEADAGEAARATANALERAADFRRALELPAMGESA